jgi:hypothetical protein
MKNITCSGRDVIINIGEKKFMPGEIINEDDS